MSSWGAYLIPFLYLYFAYRFLKKPAPFGDKDGFSTKRARESEAVWSFVQRSAGLYCLAAAVVFAVATWYIASLPEETRATVYWWQVGAQVLSIALLPAAVNLATNLKFPKK